MPRPRWAWIGSLGGFTERVPGGGRGNYVVGMPDGSPTASLTIRQLDPGLKERLRASAKRHGRSVEAEARAILGAALPATDPASPAEDPESGASLVEAFRRRFGPLGGVELELPPREPMGPPPSFE